MVPNAAGSRRPINVGAARRILRASPPAAGPPRTVVIDLGRHRDGLSLFWEWFRGLGMVSDGLGMVVDILGMVFNSVLMVFEAIWIVFDGLVVVFDGLGMVFEAIWTEFGGLEARIEVWRLQRPEL